MSQELMVPQQLSGVPAEYQYAVQNADVLGANVVSGFAVLGIRGKNFWFKQGGEETLIETEVGSGIPAQTLDVVIVKSALNGSKTYYPNGYDPRNAEPPTCFSSDGMRPDPSVEAPECQACAICPKNRVGSRTGDNGKKMKACSDNWRLAIVPAADINNEVYGGAMLLRVPAATLGEMQTYGRKVQAVGHAYFTVATQLRFDPQQAYPKLLFAMTRELDQDELARVMALRDDPKVAHILSEGSEFAGEAFPDYGSGDEVTEPAAPAPAPAPRPAAPRAAPPRAAAPAPAPAPAPRPAAPRAAPPRAAAPAPAPAPAPRPAAPRAAPPRAAAPAPTTRTAAPVPRPAPAPAPAPEPAPVAEEYAEGYYDDQGNWIAYAGSEEGEFVPGLDASIEGALDASLDAAFG